MTHIAGFDGHGDFVPDRKIHIVYEQWRQRMVLYSRLGSFKDGTQLYWSDVSTKPSQLVEVAPGEELPIYLILGEDEAEAIAEAVRPAPQVNERHLDDAVTVRDRLLTLLEADYIGKGSGEAAVHIRDEACHQRKRRS